MKTENFVKSNTCALLLFLSVILLTGPSANAFLGGVLAGVIDSASCPCRGPQCQEVFKTVYKEGLARGRSLEDQKNYLNALSASEVTLGKEAGYKDGIERCYCVLEMLAAHPWLILGVHLRQVLGSI